MLDLHRLNLLVQFARRGSIAATAAPLGYTASAVSQQLRQLEREAGVALLDRTARSATLTAAGRRLVTHAEVILAAVEEAEIDLAATRGVVSGLLTVSSFPTAAILVAPPLARLQRDFPALHIVMTQADSDDALRQVRARECDVAVLDNWSNQPLTSPPELRIIRLCRDPIHVALPRHHRLADEDGPVDIHDLVNDPWLCAPPGAPSRRALHHLMGAGDDSRFTLWEFEGLSTIAALVASGVGVALVPELAIVPDLREHIVLRELAHQPSREISAAIRASTQTAPAIEVIVQTLRASFRNMSAKGSHTLSAELRP